jgi:hypothetical protein
MFNPKFLKINTIYCIFIVCYVLILAFPVIVYSDDDNWTLIENYENFTAYYNSKLIKIDTQNHIITVWMKGVFDDTLINDIVKLHVKDKSVADEIKFIDNQKMLFDFNYQKWQYSINHITLYSSSGNILMDWEIQPEWRNILPNTNFDQILNELLSKYGIKR